MKKRYVWTIVVIVYVLLIYGHSLKSGDSSSVESSYVLMQLREFFAFIGMDSQWLTEHLVRKAAHFSEYTLLGILLMGCFNSYKFNLWKRCFFHFTLAYFIPFTDETIQLFIQGRSSQVSDVWLDISGVLFGSLFAALWLRLIKQMETNLNDKKL